MFKTRGFYLITSKNLLLKSTSGFFRENLVKNNRENLVKNNRGNHSKDKNHGNSVGPESALFFLYSIGVL